MSSVEIKLKLTYFMYYIKNNIYILKFGDIGKKHKLIVVIIVIIIS